jgi:hypothetical protein
MIETSVLFDQVAKAASAGISTGCVSLPHLTDEGSDNDFELTVQASFKRGRGFGLGFCLVIPSPYSDSSIAPWHQKDTAATRYTEGRRSL